MWAGACFMPKAKRFDERESWGEGERGQGSAAILGADRVPSLRDSELMKETVGIFWS